MNTSVYKNINLENKRLDFCIRIIRKNKPGWFGKYGLLGIEVYFFSESAPGIFPKYL